MRLLLQGLSGLSLALLAACQSASQSAAPVTAQAAPAATPSTAQAASAATPAPISANAFAPAAGSASSAQCSLAIAGGPPPKPNKGSDFGSAAAKNIGKNVGRNLLAGVAGSVAGPLGGAIAGGLAANAIRSEHDLKGSWTATDLSPNCGCAIDVSAGITLQGKTADKGKLAPRGCGNPLLARATNWTLGYSFTGYDAPFELIAADGTKLASLKRDGVDYFSGTLADGTPVTIWRK